MSAYQGVCTLRANKFSSRNESSTTPYVDCVGNLDIKYATTLAFPGFSTIVIQNSCRRSSHLTSLPRTIGFFIKYLIAVWSL